MGYKVVSSYGGSKWKRGKWEDDDDEPVIKAPAKNKKGSKRGSSALITTDDGLPEGTLLGNGLHSVEDDWGTDTTRWKEDEVNKVVHRGHMLDLLDGLVPMGGDRTGDVLCLDCEVTGEFYLIDGALFLDVDHVDIESKTHDMPLGLDFLPSEEMPIPGELVC